LTFALGGENEKAFNASRSLRFGRDGPELPSRVSTELQQCSDRLWRSMVAVLFRLVFRVRRYP